MSRCDDRITKVLTWWSPCAKLRPNDQIKGRSPMDATDTYANLSKRIHALCEGETDQVALMATIAWEVYAAADRFDWVGSSRNVGDRMLKIGPFQRGHGCLTIPFAKGVCGAVASSETALNVPMSMRFPATSPVQPAHGRNWCCRCLTATDCRSASSISTAISRRPSCPRTRHNCNPS